MTMLSYIIWEALPEFFYFPDYLPLLGGRPVRYYGLLFAVGFLISQYIMFYIYRKEGKPERDVETLTVFMVIATVIGARLGHVLFYEPDKYLSHPIEILKIWEGGLASHGAAFGILFALWLYSRYKIYFKGFRLRVERLRRPGQNYFQVVDRIVIVVALTGCLIRLGNFMNSEIYGKPTHSSYGVVYGKNARDYFDHLLSYSDHVTDVDLVKDPKRPVNEDGYEPIDLQISFDYPQSEQMEQSLSTSMRDDIRNRLRTQPYLKEHLFIADTMDYRLDKANGSYTAHVAVYGIVRHPTQLYEAGTSLLIFLLLFALWSRYKNRTPPGLLLGLFLVILFGLRFVHETFKENQVAFEDSMKYNMGQLLSIPLILAGIIIFIRALRLSKKSELD